MAQNVLPTKGNLINTKKSLSLAKMGYDLMDRKRNILIREMMSLIDKANELRDKIDSTYKTAYEALQMANITLGIVEDTAKGVPVENGLSISMRSVMGVEIPTVALKPSSLQPCYPLNTTNSQLDYAFLCFNNVKVMTAELAEIENSIYRLAIATKKTQSRANALQNIIIPRFDETVKYITEALEEKEREEFSRLKVIKKTKQKKQDSQTA